MTSNHNTAFVERVNDPEMIKNLDYFGGVARFDVAAIDLFAMPFETVGHIEDQHYWSEVDTIRRFGYDNTRPIRIEAHVAGASWHVDEEDADRFLAAKRVAGEILANLFAPKVSLVGFELHASGTRDHVRTSHEASRIRDN